MRVSASMRFDVSTSGVLGSLAERLRNIKPALQAFAPVMRSEVGKEFDAQAWLSPSGAVVPWPRLVPFGESTSDRPALIGTGAYLDALKGGSGSITEIGFDSTTIGAQGSEFPYAALHRGGATGVTDTAPIVITPKKTTARGDYSMRFALFFKYGIWIRKATLEHGLVVPRRPHLTDHPALRRRLIEVASSYFLTGRAVEA